MPDETIKCADCGRDFIFTDRDKSFYEEKGFTPPKRCKNCRDAKKAERQGGGGSSGRDEAEGNRW